MNPPDASPSGASADSDPDRSANPGPPVTSQDQPAPADDQSPPADDHPGPADDHPAPAAPAGPAAGGARAGEPVLPEQSREDTDAAWGDYPEPADDRLYRDRPPHWADY